MKPLRLLPLLVLFLSVALGRPPEALAGEITSCFTPGATGSCTRKVLQHVEFKATVTEFVDAQNTGIGHSLSRLLWREILESISNVGGAGVILAHDRQNQMADALQGRDYLEFLENDYHIAAIEIAESLNTQMSIWGVVIEDENDVLFEPFLTLLPEKRDPWTAVHLRSERVAELDFKAEIPHRRLSFATLNASRQELFQGLYITRCAKSDGCPRGVAIRGGPSNESPVVEHVPVGSEIRAFDMTEQWFEVARPDGGRGYMNIYFLEVTPRLVFSQPRGKVNIRAEPDFGPNVLGQDRLAGVYPVLAVRRHKSGEFWYLIQTENHKGWAAGRLFQRYYRLPMVHFIAGLFRYARGDFKGAIAEFGTFIDRGQKEDNVTLAAAHQFLAASRIAYSSGRGAPIKEAIEDLDQAVGLTPFDPAAYVLRSVVALGGKRNPELAFEDMVSAARLDPFDSTTVDYLTKVRRLIGQYGWEMLTSGRSLDPEVANTVLSVPLGRLEPKSQ